MSIDYQDGGAFAECFFVQHPHGLGRHPVTPAVASRLKQLEDQSVADDGAVSTAPSPSPSTWTATTAGVASDRLTRSSALVVAAARGPEVERGVGLPTAPPPPRGEALAETTARTRQALQAALAVKQAPQAQQPHSLAPEAFSGRRPTGGGALVVSTAPTASPTSADPAPIVRSPTKAPKRSALEVMAQARRTAGEGGSATPLPSTAAEVAVPFSVSSWRNKKKLIIPVEQRLAQHHDERTSAGGGLSDRIVDLARAMRAAASEVDRELQERAATRVAEEERRQAGLEEEEMRRARQLMEENAARIAQQQQQQSRQGETREQRLERLRLERELREREQVQRQRQRQLQRAAARLNMSVEDLEADESLMKALDQGPTAERTGASATAPLATSRAGTAESLLGGGSDSGTGGGGTLKREFDGNPRHNLHGDNDGGDDDDGDGGRRKKSTFQMFMRPVVSNEGIAREMEALAALERAGGYGPTSTTGAPTAVGHTGTDGIRLPNAEGSDDRDSDDEAGDEDDGGEFAMNKLMSKRQRLL